MDDEKMPSREQVAYHEAGHLVVLHDTGLDDLGVTVVPDEEEGTLGSVARHEYYLPQDWTEADELRAAADLACISLAGPVAEGMYAGEKAYQDGWGSDLESATACVASILGREARDADLAPYRERAQRILEEKWHAVRVLVRKLVRQGTLPPHEAFQVVDEALDIGPDVDPDEILTNKEIIHSAAMVDLYRESCEALFEYGRIESTLGVRFDSRSLPVTYFGRLSHPDLRVLTVGLNPSWSEFADDGLLGRRNQDVGRLEACSDGEARSALARQDRYFDEKSSKGRESRYFDLVEPFLNELGASYYESKGLFLAAHLDVRSPFATSQESSIGNADEALFKDGWDRFVRAVDEARTASLMIVIGSGIESFSRYGGLHWKGYPPNRWAHFFHLDAFNDGNIRVIGASSWGGRAPRPPLNKPEVMQEIRDLLHSWDISLGSR